jgi:NAD+ synthase (glutamine-hydrolysing)
MPVPLRLCLAQINATVGDLPGNAEQIVSAANRAAALGADVVLFPELALTGYPPEDLLLRPRFVSDSLDALNRLAKRLPPHVAALVGCLDKTSRGLHDAAALIRSGKVRAVYHKKYLPNYGVFDEKRYFVSGTKPLLFSVRGVTMGVTVCEDIWVPSGPALDEARAGARLILNLSASPYHAGKLKDRLNIIRSRVRECRAAIAYCNLVGGQDELVFDGGSVFLDASGRVAAQAPQFENHLLTVDVPARPSRKKGGRAVLRMPDAPPSEREPVALFRAAPLAAEEEIYSALMLGTRDYLRKNGFQKAVIGLSGGVDSSLVACIAVDALGKENVVGITMPSRHNAAETRSDAESLARNLGVEFHSIPIQKLVDLFLETLSPVFAGRPPDITEENLQARVRGVLLMALSNKFGWMVLTTGNKSETSVGYSTLYGDTAGGFAVVKDIPKTLLYRLCRWRNRRPGAPPIPDSVVNRAPSAELRPNQTDQDSLPPYDRLDRIISLYVEEDKSLSDIVKAGVAPAEAERTIRLIDGSEYKRRQVPPGVKITPKAFGRDRRMPITNRYRTEPPEK